MKEWYLKKLREAKNFEEAKNYAVLAGLDIKQLMTIRYLKEK